MSICESKTFCLSEIFSHKILLWFLQEKQRSVSDDDDDCQIVEDPQPEEIVIEVSSTSSSSGGIEGAVGPSPSTSSGDTAQKLQDESSGEEDVDREMKAFGPLDLKENYDTVR